MATIYDYLDRKKSENPTYRNYSNLRLYRELKGKDANLPLWEAVDKSTPARRQKSSLE